MPTLPPATRRLCFVVDLVGSSRRTDPEQHRDQKRLRRAVDRALAEAGCARADALQQDRGDGELLLFPPGIDESRAVPGLVLGLLDAVHADNARHAVPIQVRMALAEGMVRPSISGFVGRAVVVACRLVDSPELKQELARSGSGEVAFAVSDGLFHDVVQHRHGDLSPDGFRRTRIARLDGPDGYGWFWVAGEARRPAHVPPAVADEPVTDDGTDYDTDYDDGHESEDGLRLAGH